MMRIRFLPLAFLACMFLKYAYAESQGNGNGNGNGNDNGNGNGNGNDNGNSNGNGAAAQHCRSADHVFHGNKCFSIQTYGTGQDYDTYHYPECDTGRQARIYDNGLKMMLGTMADNLLGPEWECWIGLNYRVPSGFIGASWVWWDDRNVNNGPRSWSAQYDPLPTDPATACASMSDEVVATGVERETWLVKSCSDLLPCSFCEYPRRTNGANGDPHFLVSVPGMDDGVCFDYSGKDGEVVQLLYGKEEDIVINGEIYSPEQTTKTWFRALSLIVPGCQIIATPVGINVNGKDISWKEVNDKTCGKTSVTFSIENHTERNGTLLMVRVNGADYVLSRDSRQFRFGLVHYMNIDLTTGAVSNKKNADGLLGHLLQTPIKIDPISISFDGKLGDLYFPDEPGRGSVKARYVGRKNPFANTWVHCWHVGNEGAGLLRGRQDDYIVPHLLTDQRAQTLKYKL